MTYLVKIHVIYPNSLKYSVRRKDSEWMKDILSNPYDLHINGLINSFMHR